MFTTVLIDDDLEALTNTPLRLGTGLAGKSREVDYSQATVIARALWLGCNFDELEEQAGAIGK